MTWQMADGLATSLLDYFEAHYNSFLSGVEGVLDFVDGEYELESIARFPVLYVLIDSVTGAPWRGAPTKSFRQTAEVRMGVVHEAYNEPKDLRRHSYEYGKAMIEIVADGRDAGVYSPFSPVDSPTISYNPTIAQGSRYISEVGVAWSFVGTESR